MRAVVLFPLTAVNYLVIFIWDLFYRLFPDIKISSRVISVGNIAVGGTGKTSLVEYIAARLSVAGANTAVVARGYKRPSSSSSVVICDSNNYDWRSCGDEAAALARSLNEVKIYVDSSKMKAAIRASKEGNGIILIDDGFQHRKLSRDLDIVCINGENPYGNRLLLPSGILREPLRSLKRADAFVIFVDKGDIDLPNLNLPPGKPVFTARKIIESAKTRDNDSVDLAGKKVIGFCGIANPDSFYHTLAETGATIAAFEKFRDHYIYGNDDTKRLSSLMETSGAEMAVTTLKDYVKLERIWPEDKKLCYIKIKLAIENETEFIRLIGNE